MSRTRSTRASSSTVPAPEINTDADPDYLALTARQQRQIDRVFDRATRPRPSHGNNGPPKKKRRITPPIDDIETGAGGGFEDEGGFMDAGGFDPDEGGFISDEGEGGGGFMEDHEEPNQVASNTKDTSTAEDEPLRIPLRNLPAALSSLNLPSDEDVLAVFRASASGWTEQTGRYRDKEEEEENRLIGGGVELKDFRAVCAALMGPDEGGDGEDQISDDGDEDIYQDEGGDDGESSLSEITEDEYNEPSTSAAKPGTVKDKGKGKGKGRKKKVELEDNGKIRLNPRQREVVNDLWGMLKPDSAREVRGGHILGRDEVRRKVRDLGEMWTEDEITEMVTLFSTQCQGRGLSYDDFGAIMVRAGLA